MNFFPGFDVGKSEVFPKVTDTNFFPDFDVGKSEVFPSNVSTPCIWSGKDMKQ
jgi:hypothetical protein